MASGKAVVVAVVVLAVGVIAGGFVLIDGGLDGSEQPNPDADGEDGDEAETAPEESSDDESEEGEREEESEAGDGEREDSNEESDEGESEDESSEDVDPEPTASLVNYTVTVEMVEYFENRDAELRLYNETADEDLPAETRPLVDNESYTFVGLDEQASYRVAANVSYFPDEEVLFAPQVTTEYNDTLAVGYEFQGADSYKIDWEVHSRAMYDDGFTRVDEADNLYTEWTKGHSSHRTQVVRSPMLNQSFLTGSDMEEWRTLSYSRANNIRDRLARNSLNGFQNRTFIEETRAGIERDVIHVYEIPTGHGTEFVRTVRVDPETGYVLSVETDEYPEEISLTEQYSDIHNHDEEITVFPDDVPDIVLEHYDKEK